MKRIKSMAIVVLATSAVVTTAAPAQARTQARCLPEYAVVCQAIVLVCRVTGNPCAA